VAISLTIGGAAAAKFNQKNTTTTKQTPIQADLRIIPPPFVLVKKPFATSPIGKDTKKASEGRIKPSEASS
jgi:hypothetical protein